MRLAELCAGYGGLHLALSRLGQGVELAWYAEVDPDSSTVMRHHHPDAANLGDITTADWSNASPVDILAGGIPCQPWSLGGQRNGSDDERDLWPVRKHDDSGQPRHGMLDAVRTLNPPMVVIENVPGLLTGDGGSAFRTILTDLNTLGYTIRWTTMGACKLGMCHHRHRLFVMATKTDGDLPYELGMPIAAWLAWPRDGVCSSGMVWSHPSDVCGTNGVTLQTPCASDGGTRGTGLGTYTEPDGRPLREVIAMLPTPTRSDGTGGAGHDGRAGTPNLRTAVTLLPTPRARLGDRRGEPSLAQAASRFDSGRRNLDDAVALLPTPKATDAAKGGPNQRGSSGDLALPAAVQPERWGRWVAAVTRHAAAVGRLAPEPTIVGSRGGLRLNPELTEWMMGLPAGWLTDVRDDPNACNRLAGNGVVPDQAATALLRLLCRAGLPAALSEVAA